MESTALRETDRIGKHFIRRFTGKYDESENQIYTEGELVFDTIKNPTNHLTIEHFCSILTTMKGSEFIKRIRKLAKANGLPFQVRRERGKGSHITLYYADRHSILRATAYF